MPNSGVVIAIRYSLGVRSFDVSTPSDFQSTGVRKPDEAWRMPEAGPSSVTSAVGPPARLSCVMRAVLAAPGTSRYSADFTNGKAFWNSARIASPSARGRLSYQTTLPSLAAPAFTSSSVSAALDPANIADAASAASHTILRVIMDFLPRNRAGRSSRRRMKNASIRHQGCKRAAPARPSCAHVQGLADARAARRLVKHRRSADIFERCATRAEDRYLARVAAAP